MTHGDISRSCPLFHNGEALKVAELCQNRTVRKVFGATASEIHYFFRGPLWNQRGATSIRFVTRKPIRFNRFWNLGSECRG